MFVVIEGVDATGKTTLVESLMKRVRKTDRFRSVHAIGFPRYDGPLGALIKEWLVSGKNLTYPYAFQAMMATDKHQAATDLEKLLDEGNAVITSRYWQSAVAYGATSSPELKDVTFSMHRGLPIPTLNVLLDMAPAEALKRRSEKRDAYEKNLDFLEGVRNEYLELWNRHPAGTGTWIIVDASRPADEVLDEVYERLTVLLGL